MYDLTESEQHQIIGLYKGGATKKGISRILGISRTSVIRTIQNFCDGKSLKTQPWTGWPKLLNFKHQQALKQIIKKNNRLSADQIKQKFQDKTEMQVSCYTIRRSLHELQFFSRILASKPLLNN